MSSSRRLVGIWALAVFASAGMVATASARTLIVQPGQSIQRHIDRARGGDTVLVRAGTYRESVEINKGITLQGQGSVLRPGPKGGSLCNQFGPKTGICVHGKLRFSGEEEPTLLRRVPNVSIRGMNIRGFGGDGIFAFGTRDLRIRNNRLVNHGGYGIFSLVGKRPRLVHNIAERNGDAGLYVGDSPRAHAVVRNNRSSHNASEGIFLRDASIGRVTHNVVAGNCVGILLLADAPGPVQKWLIAGNRVIANNSGACPGGRGEEEGPPVSGIGIALLGARSTVVRGNVVRQHRRDHPSFASGGIVVGRGVGGSLPRGDRIAHNTALNNRPNDISWDGSGRVRFVSNLCRRSSPRRICR